MPRLEHRCVSAGLMAFTFASPLCFGCVNTDTESAKLSPVCVTAEPALPPFGSLVYVRSQIDEKTRIECSGVPIAPTLVLTDLRCVVLPSDLDPADVGPTGSTAALPGFDELSKYYMGDVDYKDSCHSDAGWAPLEDGSFSARLGPVLDVSTISVAILGERGEPVASSSVNRLFVSHAESRCWDTLAVLVLDHDLGLPPATLRLEEVSQPEEAVTLSGFGLVDGYLTRHEIPSSIESSTGEIGDATTPPRSLSLAGPLCAFETGGMVVADDSNTLVGVIGYDTDYNCEDPAAKTIATKLAPFRRLLIDAAQSTSQTLHIESPSTPGAELVPACPEPR